MTRQQLRVFIAVSTWSCLAACADRKGTTPAEITGPVKPAVATLAISPSNISLLVGFSQTLEVTALDANGTVLEGRVVTFSSNRPAVATVIAPSKVQGFYPGVATITATSEGKSASVDVNVIPVQVRVNVATVKGQVALRNGLFSFYCASGSEIPPSKTPDDVAEPWLMVKPLSGAEAVFVDSVLSLEEQGNAQNRRMERQGYPTNVMLGLWQSMSGSSPMTATTDAAARVPFTVSRVVYYRFGITSYVSPKVSYTCTP
jgi:hypothetical protein